MAPTGPSVSTNVFSVPATVYSFSPLSTIQIPISTETVSGSLSTIYELSTISATYAPIFTTSIPESITTTITPSPPNTILTPSVASSQTSTITDGVIPGSSSSPISLTIPTPKPSPRTLSSGAIAGIAIAVVSAFLVGTIGIFLYFKEKRQRSRLRPVELEKDESSPTSPDTSPEPPGYTAANRHELGTIANTHEIGQESKNGADAKKPLEVLPYFAELATNANLHEIGSSGNDESRSKESGKQAEFEWNDPETAATEENAQDFDPRSRIMEPDWGDRTLAALEMELEYLSSPSPVTPITPPLPPRSDLRDMEAPLIGGHRYLSEVEKESKILALRERMQKLREENERLQKHQNTTATNVELG